MKYIFLPLMFLFLSATVSMAQTGKVVTGVVTDTAKVTQPGSSVQIKTDLGDSSSTVTNIDGKFTFPNVRGTKISIAVSSLGFHAIIKHFTLTTDAINTLPPIVLQVEKNELKEVTIVGINPVKFTEDTIDYKVAAYKVRDNAPVEDVLKKVPGVEVDANGNVTAQGQAVTKVRINGKDFMGGDVQAATKNLPADILESIQVIDDYGDQANLTGVKTGTPNKILNFTIRADKNYGYTLNLTGGGGEDMLPSPQTDNGRYLESVNGFDFKGDRQVTLLGSLNNTNVNTFNYGGGGGGGGGFGGGNGGGRGNAARGGGGGGGGGSNASIATQANGITNARSIGTNYRDQYGKTVSIYGSYSFTDNTTYTASTTLQNNNVSTPSASSTNSQEHDNPINHRFTLNIEWRPDTINYLKVTPTFSYALANTTESESVSASRTGTEYSAYTSTSLTTSQTPTAGLIMLYNHRFHNRNNLSININSSTSQGSSSDNPIYHFTVGAPSAPANQIVNQNNTTSSVSANVDYLQHLGKVSYLDFNYTYSYSHTANDKETDTVSTAGTLNNSARLSNNYTFNYITNRMSLNYRVVEAKYNYTLGIGVLPGTLDGQSITTGVHTHQDQFNVVPTANYIYNFSRSQTLRINYNGNTSQPSFQQLQPVIDYTNALYPVQGNPDLKPSFANSVSVRYQNFGIATGNLFLFSLSYTNTENAVVNNTITNPLKFTAAALAIDPTLKNLQTTTLTKYLNASGVSTVGGQITFSKPWQERRYTLTLTSGQINYTTGIGYSSTVDSNNNASALLKNVSKTLSISPAMRFRVDVTDVVDAQASVGYSIAKTTNSVTSPLFGSNTDIRGLVLGLNGKQYVLKDWTFSYDYTKLFNYGYAASENVTNPNILNMYLERRFLKQKQATIRFSIFDAFNQNSGFSVQTNGSVVTQTNVNRLGRYYLATFTLRLQKFAGKAPTQNQDRGNRPRVPGQNDGGGRGGDGGGRGPGGGGNGGGGTSTTL